MDWILYGLGLVCAALYGFYRGIVFRDKQWYRELEKALAESKPEIRKMARKAREELEKESG